MITLPSESFSKEAGIPLDELSGSCYTDALTPRGFQVDNHKTQADDHPCTVSIKKPRLLELPWI